MRCDEVMTCDVECVYPDDTVEVAARKMSHGGIGFLPVVSSAGKVIGTLTDRDLTVRVLALGLPPTTLVDRVMTRELICVRASDDLRKAEERMARYNKSRIVCLDDNGLPCGVLSLADVATFEDDYRAGQVLRQVVGREVGGRRHDEEPHPPSW
jgi:CBS domain-containing protein